MDKYEIFDYKGAREYPQLHKYLKSKMLLKVLDLGANVPIMSYVLYHNYNCDFTSIDSDSKEGCLSYWLDWQSSAGVIKESVKKKLLAASSFYDVYKAIMELDDGNINPLISSQKIHDEIFLKKYFFETDILDFLKKEANEKFDIIIASNILHFIPFEEIRTLLQNINSHLNKNGVVFFRVQKKKKEGDQFGFNYNNLLKFQENVTSIFGDGEWFHNTSKEKTWDYSTYLNYIKE